MSDRALYVYGVVPNASPPTLFEAVRGVDPSEAVILVSDGDLAAVASAVRLDEFGETSIEENLRDPSWLAEKARAHDGVLAAAVGRTTVLPFRFGAIYRSEDQVRDLLRERTDFPATLARLEGTIELGVKAYLDVDVQRERLAAGEDAEGVGSAGRAYMQRKQLDRRLDEEVERFAARCAHDSHERLAAAVQESRTNALPQPEAGDMARTMILNGAYLVPAGAVERFRDALGELERGHQPDGVDYELSGPWPPYNFVADESGRRP